MGGEIDNDGYYQEVDEARYPELSFDDEFFEPMKMRPYGGLPQERYASINQTKFTRKARSMFCSARHAIHRQAELKYHQDVREGTYKDLEPTLVFKQCKNCKGGMIAKKADIKRGWGKFCSKSCKAQH